MEKKQVNENCSNASREGKTSGSVAIAVMNCSGGLPQAENEDVERCSRGNVKVNDRLIDWLLDR